MKYRPEIDGLRAVAVIPVVFYHTRFPGFAGGYVGVDVFFVISGYLITSIIYEEIRRGEFSVAGFYERRARRILPPLVAMCAATFPIAWLWMFPEQFESYAKSLLAVNLFSSNIFFWQEAGYFETSSDLKPLLHTWSLGVEEQFYIFFPLLLLAIAGRVRRSWLLTLVGVISVASFVLSLQATQAFPAANFYLLPTRAWELCAGALVAIGLGTWERKPKAGFDLAALLGLGLILYSVVTFDHTTAFPGVNAMYPVLGTALIVVFAVEGTMTARALSVRPLVAVGLLSYSIYLWHQPVLAFARIRLQERIDTAGYLMLIALSVGLAYLSWRYIEQPFRNRSWWSRNQIYAMAVGSATVLALGGYMGIRSEGFPGRIDPDIAEIASIADDRVSQLEVGCPVGIDEGFDPARVCVNGDFEERVILWGDSHAVALAPALTEQLNQEDKSLVPVTTLGCTPVVGYEWRNKPLRCTEKVEAMQAHILETTSPGDLVIVHGHWTLLLDPDRFDNGEGGVESSPITDPILNHAPDLRPDEVAWFAEMTSLLQRTIGDVVAQDRRVLVIYPVPEAGWHVPEHLARERLHGRDADDELSVSHELIRSRSARAYKALDSLGSAKNLARAYPEGLLCGTAIDGRCQLSKAGRPLYRDDDHLSNAGAVVVADHVTDILRQLNWL